MPLHTKEAQEADNYEYLVPTVKALFEEALAEAYDKCVL